MKVKIRKMNKWTAVVLSVLTLVILLSVGMPIIVFTKETPIYGILTAFSMIGLLCFTLIQITNHIKD